MKTIKSALILLTIAAFASLASCSQKSAVSPKTTSTDGFWHGTIGTAPNQVAIAILLRTNGTAREYDNDFYTSGTTMAASDTAAAKFKMDGSYTTSPGTASGTTNITITYYYTDPNIKHTYTNTGIISGTSMTGTWKDDYVSAGIHTTDPFTLSK